MRPDDTIPAEPPLSNRLRVPALEHHATALGYICIAFAQLELVANELITRLLQCSQEASRAVVDATGASIPTRLDLLLKLARLQPLGEPSFVSLEAVVNVIKNDICPLRNRLIHDAWLRNEPTQWDRRSSLKRESPREPKVLSRSLEADRSIESLWDLHELISVATADLTLAVVGHQIGRQAHPLGLPAELIPGSTRALLDARGQGKRPKRR